MAETLELYLMPFQEEKFEGGYFWFIQDNAPSYKYVACQKFLEENYSPNLIPHPSKSLDLNPMEKIWWKTKFMILLRKNTKI